MISWCSKKHSTFAQSTSKSEMISSRTAARELMWISKLLIDQDWKLYFTHVMIVNDHSFIYNSSSKGYRTRSKHIRVKYLLVGSWLSRTKLCWNISQQAKNVADIFTKVLFRKKHKHFKEILHVLQKLWGSQLKVEYWKFPKWQQYYG